MSARQVATNPAQRISIDYTNILVSHKNLGFPMPIQKSHNILDKKFVYQSHKATGTHSGIAIQLSPKYHTRINSIRNSPKNSVVHGAHHRKIASMGIDLSTVKTALTANSNRQSSANIKIKLSNGYLRQILKDKITKNSTIRAIYTPKSQSSLTRKNSNKVIYKIQPPALHNNLIVCKTEDNHADLIGTQLFDPICEKRANLISHIKEYISVYNEIPPTTSHYYQITKELGKGAFGIVSLGRNLLTGKQVAIKTIDRACLKDKLSKRKVFQEIYILKKIKHNNVIRLLEVFETPENVMIVMEYAGVGDLLQLIKNNGSLEEKTALKIFKQLVFGLAHIHSRYVLHRDIKLDNILLDEELGVKICDFGVSKIMQNDTPIQEQCGTPAFIAPEIIENKGYTAYYSDLWSLGVVLYSMLTASVPYKAQSLEELLTLQKNTAVHYPASVSPSIYSNQNHEQ